MQETTFTESGQRDDMSVSERHFRDSLGELDSIDFTSNFNKFDKDTDISRDMDNAEIVATSFLNALAIEVTDEDWANEKKREWLFEHITLPLIGIEGGQEEDVKLLKDTVISWLDRDIGEPRYRLFAKFVGEHLDSMNYDREDLYQEILALSVIFNFKKGGLLKEKSFERAIKQVQRYGSAVRVLVDVTFDLKAGVDSKVYW